MRSLSVSEKQVVYYSIALWPESPEFASRYCSQLCASVSSLRQFNREIPIFVFVYGPMAEQYASDLVESDAIIKQMGPYEKALQQVAPATWTVLATYPVLHRWMVFDILEELNPRQILYLDCDTFFLDDVRRLFDQYTSAGIYAREEPFSRRSHLGYDPSYLDEDRLSALLPGPTTRSLLPFNIGVCLMNAGSWRSVHRRLGVFFDYVWRFLLWAHQNPTRARSAPEWAKNLLAPVLAALGPVEPLPLPSNNAWIIDQMSLWLTLGDVPDLSVGLFQRSDVLQGGEFLDREPGLGDPVLCHYYGANTSRFFRWLETESGVLTDGNESSRNGA